MNRSRPQSKELNQRSRPSSRAGEPSSSSSATAAAAPRSGSQRRDTRNQSPVEAGPSSRGRSPTQSGPSQTRQLSRTAEDEEEERKDWKNHAGMLGARDFLRQQNLVLPHYNNQAEQEAGILALAEDYSKCIARKDDLRRRGRRLQRRQPEISEPENSPGGGPPGEREWDRFSQAVDEFCVEKKAYDKDRAELAETVAGLNQRGTELNEAAINLHRELTQRDAERLREFQAERERQAPRVNLGQRFFAGFFTGFTGFFGLIDAAIFVPCALMDR